MPLNVAVWCIAGLLLLGREMTVRTPTSTISSVHGSGSLTRTFPHPAGPADG